MEPRRGEQGAVEETEEGKEKGDVMQRSTREQNGEREKKRVKNSTQRGSIIMGLRFSRNRLHFLFKGHRGVTEQWAFRSARLADNQWHTLVLSVGSQHVRLTSDCSSPQEMYVLVFALCS